MALIARSIKLLSTRISGAGASWAWIEPVRPASSNAIVTLPNLRIFMCHPKLSSNNQIRASSATGSRLMSGQSYRSGCCQVHGPRVLVLLPLAESALKPITSSRNCRTPFVHAEPIPIYHQRERISSLSLATGPRRCRQGSSPFPRRPPPAPKIFPPPFPCHRK